MGPTPVYGARAEKPLQNADFAMKQMNICRLSGDIIIVVLIRSFIRRTTSGELNPRRCAGSR